MALTVIVVSRKPRPLDLDLFPSREWANPSRRGRGYVLSKRAGTAAWPRVARRCAGFSRPQREPGGESPEEAHPLAGILPKLSDLGQGAIGEAIEAAGAGQFGRLHKEALDASSI